MILNFGGTHWQLLRNDQDQFVDISIPQEDWPKGHAPASCTFGDVDGDGLVDLYITAVPMFPRDLNMAIFGVTYALNQPSKLYMNKVGLC